MKTRTWAPAPLAAPADAAAAVPTIAEILTFVGLNERPSEASVFGGLYLAMTYMRAKLPFSLLRASGEELVSYDGKAATYDPEFGQALASFEFFCLKEQEMGFARGQSQPQPEGPGNEANDPAPAADNARANRRQR